MTISEMHIWFRQYAQQMGLQNVRAILPEQIDSLINTSTKDVIDEIIKANIGTTNDRVITDNSKLANVNALRTLYKVKTINVQDTHSVSHYINEPYSFDSDQLQNALYFVDFAIRYKNGDKVTRWFPIRIIDDAFLADVLNDWVLSPRMRTPAMVVYKKETDTEATLASAVNTAKAAYETAASTYAANPTSANQTAMITAKNAYDSALNALTNYNNSNASVTKFDIYLGENETIPLISNSSRIEDIRCSYIKTPAVVQYLSDVGGNNVDSDLPDQLQVPMLKHAVDLYRTTMQGSIFSAQQNQQDNNREIARNNARPDNEGYQSQNQ